MSEITLPRVLPLPVWKTTLTAPSLTVSVTEADHMAIERLISIFPGGPQTEADHQQSIRHLVDAMEFDFDQPLPDLPSPWTRTLGWWYFLLTIQPIDGRRSIWQLIWEAVSKGVRVEEVESQGLWFPLRPIDYAIVSDLSLIPPTFATPDAWEEIAWTTWLHTAWPSLQQYPESLLFRHAILRLGFWVRLMSRMKDDEFRMIRFKGVQWTRIGHRRHISPMTRAFLNLSLQG